MKKNNIISILKQIKQKGAVIHCKDKTDSLMYQLKPLVNNIDYNELYVSICHYRNGEGAMEFYDVCDKLIKKYKENYDKI